MTSTKYTFTKLTQEQAAKLVKSAWSNVEDYKASGYRFGQSLYNLLPDDIAHGINGTEDDFFFWRDSDRVLREFYLTCVEPV